MWWDYSSTPFMQEGWRCPVCGRVNAPWVPTCGCISSQTTGDSIIKYAKDSKDSTACDNIDSRVTMTT